jgi:hypothetical protein
VRYRERVALENGPDNTKMGRREFLRSAGRAAGGLAVLSVGGAALGDLAGCGATHPRSSPAPPAGSSPGTTTSSSLPATTETTLDTGPPDWAALAKSLTGRLVLPGQPAYPTATQLFNPVFDSVHPAAVAYCAKVSDVQRSIEFARTHGVQIATRSGGHSFAGYSTGPGLVADVSAMSTVGVEAGGSMARVGAGARLVDLYSSLSSQGVALAGGSCPTVGIAGLTLGGGMGVVDRTHGLTCDALSSVDIVTADSRLLTCDQGSDPDLYWASQGGGGGNLGIATEFRFLVHPVDELALFTLVWPWAAAVDVVGAWSAWAQAAPRAIWANCQMGAPGQGGPGLKVTGVWVGSVAALSLALGPLLRAVGSAPTYSFVGPEPFMRAMMIEAGCEGDSVAECHLPSENPAGLLSRSAFATKSNFLTSGLSDAGVRAVVGLLDDRQGLGAPGSGGIVVSTTGGAINGVPANATAFVHRDTELLMEYNVGWDSGATAGVVAANRAWLAHAWATMQPFVSVQAYQNYMDPTLVGWQEAYYGANLARLSRVKLAYDPDDVFRFAQSIPLS